MEFTGEPENLARKFCFKGLPLEPQSAVPFRLPNGPPLPRYLVPGLERCGQRQNGWEGGLGRGKEGCRAKETPPHPCLSQWLFQAPGVKETGVGRMTEAEARHNQVSGGRGENLEGMRRGCLGTGAAVPSRSSWKQRPQRPWQLGRGKRSSSRKWRRAYPLPGRNRHPSQPQKHCWKDHSMQTWRQKGTARQGSKFLWTER